MLKRKAVLVNADGTVVHDDSGEFLGKMVEYPDKKCCECGQKVPTRFYKLATDYARESECVDRGNQTLVYVEMPRVAPW